MATVVKRTASEIRASIQLLTASQEKEPVKARGARARNRFAGSGYAWILKTFNDGKVFTRAMVQEGLIEAGILKKNTDGSYNDYASDCITRMMRTSDASQKIQGNYINWTGTVQKEGRNEEGESEFTLTRRGLALGRKLELAEENGLPVRGHHIAKRIDKDFKATAPTEKRGFRKTKGYDVLARTKAVRVRKSKSKKKAV